MWIRGFTFTGVMAMSLFACMAQTSAPATQGDNAISVTGTLHTGVVAVGGETTGTELSADKNGGYELDLTAHAELVKKADALNGQQVSVTGTLTTKAGVERSPRHIIKVETLEKADTQK